jgi:hypothetical protein
VIEWPSNEEEGVTAKRHGERSEPA